MLETESMMDKSVFWAVSVYSSMKLRTFPYSVETLDTLSLNVRTDLNSVGLLTVLSTTLLGRCSASSQKWGTSQQLTVMASLWEVELLSHLFSFIEELAVPRALAVECSWGLSCCVTVTYPLTNCQSFDISYVLGDQILKEVWASAFWRS